MQMGLSSLRRTLRGGRRRSFVVVAIALLLAVGSATGLGEDAGFGEVLDSLRRIDPTWLAVCFGGEVLAYFGYILAYRETARVEGGPTLDFTHIGKIVSAGFGPFFAARAAGGFAVDYSALRNAGLRPADAMARVLGLNALEYAVLAPAALAAALTLLVSEDTHVPLSMTVPWLLVVPGIAAALWISQPSRSTRLAGSRDGGRVSRAMAHGVAGVTILRRLLGRPQQHGAGLAGAILYWTGDILCLWAGLRAFHVGVAVASLVIAYATGYALTRRSMPAGGPGAVEAFLTFALVWVGVPLAPALLGVFAYRLFNFWLALVPALAVLPTVRRFESAAET
jgi:uncharacterized membrane protein YbhN (UPF0104 family)